jgi:D-serine deaminase-like pyridoxal phosphate-dependent protein
VSKTLADLLTPALVLDRGVVVKNCRAMTARARDLGVALRPHLKTAKSADVARLACDGNAGGITVSTLREAAYFLEHGLFDITYAVCIPPGKLDAAANLMARGAELSVLTDDADAARAIAGHGAPFQVLVEVDTGGGRGGVDPAGLELLEIGRVLHEATATRLRGILTHAGQSYDGSDADAIVRVAEGERAGAVLAARRLEQAGLPCPVVSVGSTPAAVFARDLSGATEMRPGVYTFYDLYQAGIGVCGLGDIALSVLATVIGRRPADNALIVDAGALALSKDRSTGRLPEDRGYGLVCDAETGTPLDGLVVASVNQEHGMVTGDDPIPFERFPVGARVRILPNHACMTAAAYDAYNVVEGGADVIAAWPRCNGW